MRPAGVIVCVVVPLAAVVAGATYLLREPAWQPTLRELESPASGRSAEPQLTALDGHPILSWIERTGEHASLKFSNWSSRGWTAPLVAAEGDDWFVNWADVPSVVRLPSGVMAAHWLQKSGDDQYAYDVRLSFSHDGGHTWSSSVTPHHDGTPNEHGFASLFASKDDGVGLVWLDGRAMRASTPGEEPTGSMTLRAATFSPDSRQLTDSLIDDRVCECCPTAVAATRDGVVAAFRNRAGDETRDIHVARLEQDHWTQPVPVHDDGWRIDACPVNGPALSARERDVVIAWFNAKADQGHAFVAFSHDAGRTFSAPVRVDDSATLGRVDVEMLDPRTAIAAWIEYADGRAQFRIRRVTESGHRSKAMMVTGLAAGRASGYPRLGISGHDLLLAWTETGSGSSRIKTAAVSLDR